MILLVLSLFVLSTVAQCPVTIPPWTCPPLAAPPPADNVLQLRPGNIKAIMAMGDSITAGFAMIGYPPTDLIEDRDYVFSTGGASGAFTLATIIKRYNPSLQGASESWTLPLTKGKWLDAGVSMAKVEDCPSQVTYLVNALKTTYKNTVNFNTDWKLLTLFIGANNICGACQNRSNSFPAYFEQHLRAVLTQIETTIPRVFVNLVPIFNISGVYYAGKTSEYCTLIHRLWPHECYCVETGKPSDLQAMDDTAMAFNQISKNLAAEFSSKKKPGLHCSCSTWSFRSQHNAFSRSSSLSF